LAGPLVPDRHRAQGQRSPDRDIGLFTPADDPAVARIGYTLSPDWQGRGLAREAVAALIAYLFGSRAKRRIIASTLPDNAPSQRLLAALGFRRTPSLDLDGERGMRWSVKGRNKRRVFPFLSCPRRRASMNTHRASMGAARVHGTPAFAGMTVGA